MYSSARCCSGRAKSCSVGLTSKPHVQKPPGTTDPGSPLYIVRDDHHGVMLLEIGDRLHHAGDAGGGNGIEGTVGLVLTSTSGWTKRAWAMQSRWCWPPLLAAAQMVRIHVEAVYYLVPQGGLLEGVLHEGVHIASASVDPRAPGHVFMDGLGKGLCF